MQAYAILDGGGVKGAALAGALKAAQDRQIEFVGYGGTSAGSIVALLASVGYSGAELEEKFVEELDFATLLDDGNGRNLKDASGRIRKVTAAIKANPLAKAFKALPACVGTLRLVQDVWRPLGIYPGKILEEWLDKTIRQRLPTFSKDHAITFEDLHKEGKAPLRIVASNITRRRAVIYSCEKTGGPVVDAVRASAGYPFVFRPVTNAQGERLVDGGIASNLPAFLFAEEHRRSRIPVLAFDLVSPEEPPPPNYDGAAFCRELLDTAIEAGDELLRVVLKGIEHIPIKTPAGIDTLDFNLARPQRQALFNAGYANASEWLNHWKPLELAMQPAQDARKELILRYGEPDIYQPLLWAAGQDIEARSNAKQVWTAMLLPTGRNTFLMCYHHGADSADGYRLHEFDGTIPWLKEVWQTAKPSFADYQSIRANPGSASRAVIAAIPLQRSCCLCCPIPATEGSPVALLLADTTTPSTQTGWVDRAEGVPPGIRETIKQRLALWANLIDRVMP